MLRINNLSCLVAPPVAASAALRHAAHLVRAQGAASDSGVTLRVVCSEESVPANFEEAIREEVAQLGDGITLRTNVLSTGDDAEAVGTALKRFLNETDVELLVLDPPSDRGAVPPLAENSTQTLVKEVKCPIFLVEEAGPPTSIERILVPTDLSDESIHTLRHATELAAAYNASVLLLHVIDTSPYVALTPVDRLSLGSTSLTEHRARRRLQQFLEEAHPPDVSILTRVAFGDPADRIAHFVSEESVDLLVLASHGSGTAADALLGSVADRVLRRVACPTLLFQAGDRSLLLDRSKRNSGAKAEPDG